MPNVNKQRAGFLFAGAALAGIVFIMLGNSRIGQSNVASRDQANQLDKLGKTTDSGYSKSSLANASPEEVGKYAQIFTQRVFSRHNQSPKVLLARSITSDQFTELGLGCLSFASFEKPPLVLVILKGDFDTRSMPGAGPIYSPLSSAYLGLVFDLWAATPASIISSDDGSVFRKALNDPTLPTATSEMPNTCPTVVPIVHYGQTVPGSSEPPKAPVSKP